jgi:hypothetical protein
MHWVQMLNLRWKPYTDKILDFRANRLKKAYPEYNGKIVADFARSDNWT